MANVYLVTFDPMGVDPDAVLDFLEQADEVADYHTSVPTNLIVVVTPLEANALTAMLKGVGGLANFVVVRADPSQLGDGFFGWMPKAFWEFIARHFRPAPVTPIGVLERQPQPA